MYNEVPATAIDASAGPSRRFTATASNLAPGRITVGGRLSYRRRLDRRSYWVLDTRVARAVGRGELFVEGSNLLDTEYQEVRGVDMPGRWLRTGMSVTVF